jgi:hypothetical protein
MASQAHGSSSSSWAELPAEIMQQIVQQLPLRDRLNSCSLISPAWAAAVAAAPVSCVDLARSTAASLQRAWQRYLAKLDCQQLTSVRLAVDHPSCVDNNTSLVKGLPAGLHSLDLSGLPLRLNASVELLQSARRLLPAYLHSSSDDMPAAAAATQAAQVKPGVPVDALASLTRLQLDSVRLQTDRFQPVVIAAFMQLTGLRHLHLHKVRCDELYSLSTGNVVLSSLQQLTYLNITDCSRYLVTPTALKHLTALIQLQHLGVGGTRWAPYPWLPLAGLNDCLLPLTQLTVLELTHYSCSGIPAPGFAALPKLQRLCLNRCRIDPATFAAVQGLQHLGLYDCGLSPQQHLQPQAVFFSWLQQQPLTHLIQDCHGLTTSDASASAQACAAVTASTALRELDCPWLFLELPAQRQLLHLTGLSCSLSSDSAKQLVSCCPAVQQLELGTGLRPELLLPLTGLTSLSLPLLEDNEVPQLLQLTRLQALSLHEASISDQGLQQLTPLRQLTRLHVWSYLFSESIGRASIGRSRCVKMREVGSVVLWVV